MGLNPINVGQGDPLGAHLIVGNRGAGKSNVGMRKMSWWLVHTQRIVVTNLAVRIDPWTKGGKKMRGWQEKLERSFDYEGQHLSERVWTIPRDDMEGMRFWWHIRGFGWEIPWVTEEEWKKGRRLDFRFAYRWVETPGTVRDRRQFREMSLEEIHAARDRGELEEKRVKDLPKVVYGIDEMVALYPADDYKQLHPEFTYYFTQMRKPGDQSYLFGTDGNLILKRARTQVDDTLFLENLAKQQKFCFRLPGQVKAAKFHKFPESERAKPMVSGVFQLRPEEWGETYDTSSGVGEGFDDEGMADIGEKRPGISYWWALALVPLIILVLVNARSIVNFATGAVLGKKFFGGGAPAAQVVQPVMAQTNQPGQGTVAGLREAAAGMFVQKPERSVGSPLGEKEERLFERRLTGIVPIPGALEFYWSDGEVTSTGDREFEAVIWAGLPGKSRPEGVRWSGKTYRLTGGSVRHFSSVGPSGVQPGSL